MVSVVDIVFCLYLLGNYLHHTSYMYTIQHFSISYISNIIRCVNGGELSSSPLSGPLTYSSGSNATKSVDTTDGFTTSTVVLVYFEMTALISAIVISPCENVAIALNTSALASLLNLLANAVHFAIRRSLAVNTLRSSVDPNKLTSSISL